MRLIDRILGHEPVARAGYFEGEASGAALLLSSYGTPDRERIQSNFVGFVSDAYASNAVVYAVILARISLFSEAQLCLMDRATRTLDRNDPALALLETPWPNGTTGELLVRMEQDVCLAGNSYTRRLPSGNRLERLRPDWVTIVSELVTDPRTGAQHREVLGYLYAPPVGQDDREPEFIPVDEVAHWSPVPDPLASFRGMTFMTSVLREINADIAMTAHKQKYLDRAATPNIVVRYPQSVKIDDRKLERLRSMLEARHAGPDNAGRTLLLDEGADLTVVGNSFQQMAFHEVQAAGENRIAAAGGVPGIVVGLKEGLEAATYSNYEQAMRRFADITMRPEWRSACAALAPIIDVPAGKRLWYDPSDIAALRQGELDRATTFNWQARSADLLIRGGWEPESITAAVEAADLSLLKHTGAIPTALYPGGKAPDETSGGSDLTEPPAPQAKL